MTLSPGPDLPVSDPFSRAQAYVRDIPEQDLVGLLFHPMVIIGPDHDPEVPGPLGLSTRELIVNRGIRHLCLAAIPSPSETAEALARLQVLATSTGSRLPITFSTDPRHSFLQNLGATHPADGVSRWPEPIGLGAIGDPKLAREFGQVVRHDYRAMGIRMALHPQVDLATEPRWARQAQSFGADPDLTSRLLRAYVEGLQGPELDGTSVAATVKHFPGGGPQKDGEDPHFPYGREQVYPAGRFEDHLLPFRTAIEANAAAIMPYYGMPVGLELNGLKVDEVGFAFNRAIITDLLRDELGYTGVVLSDFGLVHDASFLGKSLPARAWGVEHLDASARMARLLNAGVDQLGGESSTEILVDLLDRDVVGSERFLEAVHRVVSLTLQLHPENALALQTDGAKAIPLREHVDLGARAQSRAVTVLHNDVVDGAPLLPLRAPRRIHLLGLSADVLPEGWAVAPLEDAELTIVRLAAPFDPRDEYFMEASMEQGTLEFSSDTVGRVAELASRAPVIVAVTLSRPAILNSILPHAAALVVEFGASDRALMDALTGSVAPEGRLPFELPRSMDAVRASSPDARGTPSPLYPIGSGLVLDAAN